MGTEEKSLITLSPVKDQGELLQALAIREVVFIEEQHVPEGIERDADDATAYHLLAFEGGHAVGTGRLVMIPKPAHGAEGRWAQVGRMAVLKASRKHGVGSMLLRALEDEAKRREVTHVMLHAQSYAVEFYKKHGYQGVGAEFDEAGIQHLEMHKQL